MGSVYTASSLSIKQGIVSSDVTAESDDILSGKKTITSDSNNKVVLGTMPDNGSVSKTLSCGENIKIAKGYHDGTGIITAKSLASQTPASATSSKILSGSDAWVNGAKVSGSIQSVGGGTITPSKGTQTFYVSGKYLISDIVVNPIPSNYLDPSSFEVFKNGGFLNGFGWSPYLYTGAYPGDFTVTTTKSLGNNITFLNRLQYQLINKVFPNTIKSLRIKLTYTFTRRATTRDLIYLAIFSIKDNKILNRMASNSNYIPAGNSSASFYLNAFPNYNKFVIGISAGDAAIPCESLVITDITISDIT